MKPFKFNPGERVTLTMDEAARALSISVRTLYRMIDTGSKLEFRHVGKRRVVLARSIEKELGL